MSFWLLAAGFWLFAVQTERLNHKGRGESFWLLAAGCWLLALEQPNKEIERQRNAKGALAVRAPQGQKPAAHLYSKYFALTLMNWSSADLHPWAMTRGSSPPAS